MRALFQKTHTEKADTILRIRIKRAKKANHRIDFSLHICFLHTYCVEQ